MILKEIVLTQASPAEVYKDQEGGTWFKNDLKQAIYPFVYTPKITPKKIWIQFHSTPGAERTEFQVQEVWEEKSSWPVLKNGKTIDVDLFDTFLTPLIGKTVYVEVWYEWH